MKILEKDEHISSDNFLQNQRIRKWEFTDFGLMQIDTEYFLVKN